jgi:hypothetical protein
MKNTPIPYQAYGIGERLPWIIGPGAFPLLYEPKSLAGRHHMIQGELTILTLASLDLLSPCLFIDGAKTLVLIL